MLRGTSTVLVKLTSVPHHENREHNSDAKAQPHFRTGALAEMAALPFARAAMPISRP